MTIQIWCSAHQFGAQLPATPRGARQARQLAVEKLLAWGMPTDGPALIVAELAANAVTHGRVPGRDFLVVLSLAGGALRIEVVDTCRDRIPLLRDAGASDEGGRGLAVVEALADRWGVEQGPPPRKAVWAEVDLPTGGTPAGS
ncbi:ATP-binding protein [Streptomyces sp. NPDC090077]|uniref:ATP-binding protein n=1 Tax=Streptomyces sp. NPDC090077 TaxID=3365938 RepID=UPI003813FD6F